MKLHFIPFFGFAALAVGVLATSQNRGHDSQNDFGLARTVSSNGRIDTDGPFFRSLGTNGRACVTCHVEDEGWSFSAEGVRKRFDRTQGLDPIFRTVDGSNSPRSEERN